VDVHLDARVDRTVNAQIKSSATLPAFVVKDVSAHHREAVAVVRIVRVDRTVNARVKEAQPCLHLQ
jgi:hypothetical protein